MRKSLFTSSTALNQLKLMCNMLGRPEEASWFRGRRVFRGTCHPKNRGRRVFKWCALKVTSKIWWWILFWGWTIPLAVWQYLSTNRVLFYLQVHVEALVVEAKSTTMESAHQKCLGKCKSTHQENVHFTTELNLESLTLHETNSSPIKMVVSNRQVLFHKKFRGYVKLLGSSFHEFPWFIWIFLFPTSVKEKPSGGPECHI